MNKNNLINTAICIAIFAIIFYFGYSPLKNAYHSYQANKYSIEKAPAAASYPEIYKHWEYGDWYYDVAADTFVNFLNSPLAKFDTNIISKESLTDFMQECDVETIPILGVIDTNIIQKYHNHIQSRFRKVQHKQLQIFNISDSLTRFTGIKNKTFLVVKNSYAYPEAYIISDATHFFYNANYGINSIIPIAEVSETPAAFTGFNFKFETDKYENNITKLLVLTYEKNNGDKSKILISIDASSVNSNKILKIQPQY
jgi:hypothetical protein